MLDFIRNHKRLMMVILALFVVPGLGLVGIQGFRNFFDDTGKVASVNGHDIAQQDYDSALQGQLAQMQQTLGSSYDQSMIDTPAFRRSVLDNMIQRRLISDETQRLNLSASDDAVRRTILTFPAISALRKPDGTIDVAQYQQMLAAQGMTPDQFQQAVRGELAASQLPDSIQSTGLAPSSVVTQLISLSEQQRETQALLFNSSGYRSNITVTDAQLKAYYDAHQQDFRTPETTTIDYVVLSGTALAAANPPTDAEMHQYYQDNLAHYRTDAEVRASHILIQVAKDASADARAKAKAKAESILAQVRQHPDQFAALAKQDSDDKGSAANGGDLGYFGRGMMVKPFEDAAFGLKAGQISDVVQSDFGYHIIEVTDIKPAVTKPYDDVKGDIAAALASQRAAKLFTDAADSFSNTVYEQASSLKPAADKFKLQIQSASVTRTPNPALQPADPLNNAKFLTAVFADDSLKNKHNTAAVDLGNNSMIAAHVTAYQPSAIPPLEQIKTVVQQKVLDEQSAEAARKDGAARLAALLKSNATDGFGPVVKVSRGGTPNMSPQALAAIFKANATKLPTYVGVDLGPNGYAIYRINAIDSPAAPDAQHLKAVQQQFAQITGAVEWREYLAALRARAHVKIYGNGTPQESAPVSDDGN